MNHERPLLEQDIDAYRMSEKLREPTICPSCGAVYLHGRWQWVTPSPHDAVQQDCPACKRIQDNYPAGYVTLEGSFFHAHTEEIMRIIHNHEQHERAEHPLKRIISIEKIGTKTVITTTDIHLARGIAEAVKNAYHGDLSLQYTPGENLLRAYWVR